MSDQVPSTNEASPDTAEEAANARIVQSWFDFHSSGDIDAAYALVDEGVLWETPRAPQRSKIMTRDRVKEIIKTIIAASKGEVFTFRILQQVTKGDVVVTRAESYVPMKNGKVYSNQYTFWFKLRGGLIVHAHEYVDTIHVTEALEGVF